jgi:hypothetical protein
VPAIRSTSIRPTDLTRFSQSRISDLVKPSRNEEQADEEEDDYYNWGPPPPPESSDHGSVVQGPVNGHT